MSMLRYQASKSTFKFSIQRTFEKSVDDGEKVNEYAKGRPVGAMAREDRRGEAEEYTVVSMTILQLTLLMFA